MSPDAHNKSISLLFLILFTVIVLSILLLSGGGAGFMLAPMACDSPTSCSGTFSHLAVSMVMLYPIVLIICLIWGWVCYFSQQYNRSLWVSWGCSIAWLVFVFINLN
ncbi:hypothetical protein lpari_02459 [Legionella parisiensis]|uniref:Uncharacterized protein n=1 Tax=Legionella parisiensis TaxID=45071 RepID=A0A1E5JR43_9GAMM|nr:hypothetical protein lpari_02459 [Legionella parisiensis]